MCQKGREAFEERAPRRLRGAHVVAEPRVDVHIRLVGRTRVHARELNANSTRTVLVIRKGHDFMSITDEVMITDVIHDYA